MYELVRKLNNLKSSLRKLNKEKISKVERKAEEAMKELKACQEKIQQDPTNEELLKMERLLSEDCNNWTEARNQYLRQNANYNG